MVPSKGLILTPGSHHLLGRVPWDLAPNANTFPPLRSTRISRISSCLFNYIPRMDCTLVLTRNQTSKNVTVGKLEPPHELCQTREHMHWEARQRSVPQMPTEDLPGPRWSALVLASGNLARNVRIGRGLLVTMWSSRSHSRWRSSVRRVTDLSKVR